MEKNSNPIEIIDQIVESKYVLTFWLLTSCIYDYELSWNIFIWRESSDVISNIIIDEKQLDNTDVISNITIDENKLDNTVPLNQENSFLK